MATAFFTTTENTKTSPGSSTYEVTFNPVQEGSAATITIKRISGADYGPDQVEWKTLQGSATASSDFTAASGSFNLRLGESTTISINTLRDNLVEGNETFQVQFTDHNGNDRIVVLTIEQGIIDATVVNSRPDAVDDSFTTSEDTALQLTPSQLLGNDTDADRDALTITSVQGASNGTVGIVDGKVVFTPTAHYHGTASFTYTISDGKDGTDTATVSITVTPVNDAPVAAATGNSATGDEDTSITGTIPAGSDVDSTGLTYELVAPVTGLALNPNGSFSYQGAENANGEVAFQYRVVDPQGGKSAEQNFTITVTPVNDAPVAAATGNSATGDEDTSITGTIPAGSDVDSTGLTYELVAPVTGLALNPNGSFSYQGAENANGEVAFQYRVVDPQGGKSAEQNFTITVTPVNDAPVAAATGNSATGDEDTSITGTIPAGSDVDSTGLTYELVAPVTGLALNPNGSFSYQGAENANGEVAFQYRVVDPQGGKSAEQNFTITVTPVNDAPVAAEDFGNATEDGGAVLIDVLGNDTDPDSGDAKTLVSVDKINTTVGTVSISNGQISYAPGDNFQSLKARETTTDTFTYTMKDTAGLTSTATVTMTITGVNDGPTAVADTGAVDEDQSAVLDLLWNDTDVDGDILTIVEAKAAFGTAYIVQVDGKSFVEYTASADAFDKLATGSFTSDTITYKVSDGAGGFSTTQAVIKVTGVADGIVRLGTNQADYIISKENEDGIKRDETIEGLNGNDILDGMNGADRLIGGNGDDKLFGRIGWDELYGDNGKDILDGGAGRDTLDGGLGNDWLTGGADADTFHFGKANGNDTITDFEVGVDRLQFEAGVSIKSKSLIDTDGNGSMDSTLLHLTTGFVTLNSVTDAGWDSLT